MRLRSGHILRLDPKTFETNVGQYRYETPPNRILTVSREGDRPFVDISKGFKSELFAGSEAKFFLKIAPRQVTFIRDDRQVTPG
jgi:hypothetical protein